MTLQEHIAGLPLLSEASKKQYASLFVMEDFRKRQDVFRKGKPATDLYYIEKGILREYKVEVNEEGEERELTYWFVGPGEWYYQIESYSEGLPATVNLETLTDVRIWSISKDAIEQLAYKNHDIALQFMKLQERYLRFMSERCKYFQNRSLTERYVNLLERKTYLKEVSDKVIATYLDTCPQSISRIRKGSL